MNFTPTKPDEYFMPKSEDGSEFYQSQLEQQQYEEEEVELPPHTD
jgi:hypothetical protein